MRTLQWNEVLVMALFRRSDRTLTPELEQLIHKKGTFEYIACAIGLAMAAFLMGQLGWWFPGGSTLGSWIWLLVWALVVWVVYCIIMWWRSTTLASSQRFTALLPYLLLAAFVVIGLWLSLSIMLATHQAETFAAWLIGNDNMGQRGILRFASEVVYTDTGRVPLNFDFVTINVGLFAVYLIGAFAYLELYRVLAAPVGFTAVEEITPANVWKSIGKGVLVALVCIVVTTIAIMPSIGWSTIIVSGL